MSPEWMRCARCHRRTTRALRDADCETHRTLARSPVCRRITDGRRCSRLSTAVTATGLAVCRIHEEETTR